MLSKEKTLGVILSGGIGQRLGSSIPKQFIKLNGKMTIQYVIEAFQNAQCFDEILLVLPSLDYSYIAIKFNLPYVVGGNERNISVFSALEYANLHGFENIVFHDAARPLIKSNDLRQYIDALAYRKGVITVAPIKDSLYDIPRDKTALVQTPEAFKVKELTEKFNLDKVTTAIYEHIYPEPIEFIELDHSNYKLTTPEDLILLESLLKFTKLSKKKNVLFSNQHILLLGVTGGIGNYIYKTLLKRKVIIDAPTRTEIDLSSPTFIEDLKERFQEPDIILNLSRVAYKDSDGIVEKFETTMNINLRANLQLIEYAKQCRKRPINIVCISSSSASKGRENLTNYSASKAGLHSVIESQAPTLAKNGIYLNCICQEKVLTPLCTQLHGDKQDLREVLLPEELTNTLFQLCVTSESGLIVPIRKGF